MKKINFAIIGSGLMAKIYSLIIQSRTDCKLISIVGNTKDKTNSLAKEFNCKAYYDGNWNKMLNEDSDKIDAVIIATPEWIRVNVIRDVIKYHKHILLEKPLAVNMKDADLIKNMLCNFNKKFMVCHSLRFSPRYSQAKLSIDNKNIGELRHIYGRQNPNRTSVKRVHGKFNLSYWILPHDIDLMRWFLNDEVEHVYAITRNYLKSEDDYLIVHLHFKNGADAIEECSWTAPQLSLKYYFAQMEIRGTKGSIEVNSSNMNVDIFTEANSVSSPETYEYYNVHGSYFGLFYNLMDHFVKCIIYDKEPLVGIEDSYKAIQVCAAIERSINSGEKEYI
jgi:UDP-N-acetylglucosamine 3-dehydrogenase